MKLVLATMNRDKAGELSALLALPGLELAGLWEFPGTKPPEETGATLLENATLKAEAALRATGLAAVADDTGLEVDALGGAPGVHAARFAGPRASYADNLRLLLARLTGVPADQRGARFRTVCVAVFPGGERLIGEGVIEGRIAEAPRGESGFGYDPVFELPELGKTFAELGAAEKNALSHRARAARARAGQLRGGPEPCPGRGGLRRIVSPMFRGCLARLSVLDKPSGFRYKVRVDPILNPYTPGAGSRPPALTGRDAEIHSFRILLERVRQGRPEKSLLITGLRGVGKTVLLSTFRDLAESAGFKTAETEVTHEASFKQMMARLGRRVLLELNPVERVKDKALQAARVFKAFTLRMPGGYEIGFDIDAARGKADSGNLSEDLSDLFFALGEGAREKGAGVVFLFDEIQFLVRGDMEALIAALHYVTQRSLPVTVVGAGLPQLPKLAGEAKSYAERLFNFPSIDRLTEEAAREALVRPAREQAVEYEGEATDAIVKFTEGYPYFLQEFGKHVWNLAPRSPITLRDVELAGPGVQAQLDENFFRVRVGRTTVAELRYISAMASLGRGPYRTGDIAAKLGTDSPRVAPQRNQLINKGLVYSPSHGITDFTVPQFDDFARRCFPLDKMVNPARRR